jgi:hypothetical protein
MLLAQTGQTAGASAIIRRVARPPSTWVVVVSRRRWNNSNWSAFHHSATRTQAGGNKNVMPERGILFSAPCLDPHTRAAVTQQQEVDKEELALSISCGKKKVEKGILFSAPCLDLPVNEIAVEDTATPTPTHLTADKKRVEKGVLFAAPCLDMDFKGHPK